MTRIIGIIGGAGAGKTTASMYMKARYGTKLYALADPLKVVVSEAFDIPLETFHGTQRQKSTIDLRYELSPRELMQRVGDGIRAGLGTDTMVNRCLDQIRKEQPEIALVTDVRRLNEVDALRAAGAELWRLHYAPDLERPAYPHPTETEWKTCYADIELEPGVGGVEQLYTCVDMAFRDNPSPMAWLKNLMSVWEKELQDCLDPSKAVGDQLDAMARLVAATRDESKECASAEMREVVASAAVHGASALAFYTLTPATTPPYKLDVKLTTGPVVDLSTASGSPRALAIAFQLDIPEKDFAEKHGLQDASPAEIRRARTLWCLLCNGTGEQPADAISRYGLKPNYYRPCVSCDGSGKEEA